MLFLSVFLAILYLVEARWFRKSKNLRFRVEITSGYSTCLTIPL